MREIIVIGTLHAGATPNSELKEVLERYKPDRLLVEMAQVDINNKRIRKYPPEMRFAYNWAKKNNLEVYGFDTKDNTNFAKGMTKKDNLKVIDEQWKLLGKHTWKDTNKERYNKLLDTESSINLIDWKKEKIREAVMLRNVKKKMLRKGRVVIITGCGHLNFWEKRLKTAKFPFR
jgi:pheromone shutdown protein TraB